MASKVEDEAILTSKTDLLMSRSFDPFLAFFLFSLQKGSQVF